MMQDIRERKKILKQYGAPVCTAEAMPLVGHFACQGLHFPYLHTWKEASVYNAAIVESVLKIYGGRSEIIPPFIM